jgi:hypothetical protein
MHKPLHYYHRQSLTEAEPTASFGSWEGSTVIRSGSRQVLSFLFSQGGKPEAEGNVQINVPLLVYWNTDSTPDSGQMSRQAIEMLEQAKRNVQWMSVRRPRRGSHPSWRENPRLSYRSKLERFTHSQFFACREKIFGS